MEFILTDGRKSKGGIHMKGRVQTLTDYAPDSGFVLRNPVSNLGIIRSGTNTYEEVIP